MHRRCDMNQPTLSPPDEFATPDLGVSAFLVASGFPLLRVDTGTARAQFIFPGSAAETAHLFYQAGRNSVDARRFHVALRDLRGLARGSGRR